MAFESQMSLDPIQHEGSTPATEVAEQECAPAVEASAATSLKTAPVWLQRMSLLILVLFCVYLGVVVTVVPWWASVWDQRAGSTRGSSRPGAKGTTTLTRRPPTVNRAAAC